MKLKASMRLRNAAMITWRSQRGFNQMDAAEFCGVTPHMWMRLEKLDYPKAYPEDVLFAISCSIGIPIDEILPEELRGQNFGNTFSQEIEATNAQLRTLVASQNRYFERSLLPAPDDLMSREEAKVALNQALRTLTYREKTVLEKRFGLDGYGSLTLQQVSRRLKISRERVHMIEAKAIRKLRDPRRMNIIEPAIK